MILQPSNNALPSSSYSGSQSFSSEKNTLVSSSDLAEASFNPSVNVKLSSSRSAPLEVPPIYSKPIVNSSLENGMVASKSSIQSEALVASRFSLNETVEGGRNQNEPEVESDDSGLASNARSTNQDVNLSEEEQKVIDALKARDLEVRAHEQAHKAVGGQYAGAIALSYESGPDGKRYAMSGEVPIDVSPVPGDPQATITKMMVVSAAATAPANPSAQDRTVAAEASRLLSEAQAELAAERANTRVELREKQQKSSEESKENVEKAEKQNAYTEGLLSKIEEISQMGEETQALLDAIA